VKVRRTLLSDILKELKLAQLVKGCERLTAMHSKNMITETPECSYDEMKVTDECTFSSGWL